ncbi:RecQ family ATP-dependent DNA helicase [Lacticaseibacillus daqingensis]|uniref:RecQ family ATP-dependent DNA helicase n=1 Tax=Lacticaseibacillus daqingensis TaxID=2486014 RepID=UPI000F7727A0|nr:RecQ family ATP-dependent DNA helicase [Lacticaseibacillus daqingensis]
MTELDEALTAHFGFTAFRPGQRPLIAAVMAGRDALGVLPTGSGKTLCYQLPGRLLPGTVLVVEPLLALMEDQVARLQASGEKRVVALSSRLDAADMAQVLAQLASYRFVFVAPETLMKPAVLQRLAHVPLSLFVVDEAHCISQWGPDFRPAYLQLGAAIQQLNPRSVLALTATAPAAVQRDITQGLGLRDPLMQIASVDRPNVFLGVETVGSAHAKDARLDALVQAVAGPVIVYFDRKATAEATSARLQAQGVAAAYYHADLTAAQRDLIQRQFMVAQLRVICATSAFGMGIDKPDVRLVVYTHVPESLEAYTQGIGRAGRDGQFSASLLLMGPGDYQRAAQFAQALPDAQLIQTVFKHPEAYVTLDDPQVMLVEAYIKAGFSQAQVLTQLRARRGDKQRGLDAMGTFLQAPTCHRAALLAHFDAPPVAHHERCCGALTPAVLAQLAPGTSPQAAAPTTWRAIFQRIFTMN